MGGQYTTARSLRLRVIGLTSVAAIAIALAIAFAKDDARETGSVAESALPSAAAPVSKPAQVAAAAPRAAREHNEQRVLELERAMVSNDPRLRETAFNLALPELLDSEPARVVELVARQQGEMRDALRDEVVRLWIRKDRDAALVWMGSFENEWERKASATIAMRTLAAIDPAQAVAVADQFGVGRDDGSLEHIVQIWAAENFEETMKWLEAQPDNAQTAQLRARIQ